MAYKLKIASDILLRISVLFILQAIILLMISNYQRNPAAQKDIIQDTTPETPKEKVQKVSKSKAKSKSSLKK
jgi:hypothetical protein